MTAAYGAAFAHDAAFENFALAIAVKDSTGTVKLVDSGASAPTSAGELTAAAAALTAAGYTVATNQYASGWLAHAQADAQALV